MAKARSLWNWLAVAFVLRGMYERKELRADYRRARFLLRQIINRLPASVEVQELEALADKYAAVLEIREEF